MQNNKKKTILFITNYKLKKILELLPSRKKFLLKYFNCDNKKNLKNLKHYLKKKILNDHIIISFSNSYIFKKEELKKFKDIHKINFHPATPKYPGRDTSHFACYNREKEFGGTMHSISSKIDNGKIIDANKFKVKKKKPTHYTYTSIGHSSICLLLKKNINKILNSKISFKQIKWSKKLYTRKMFLKMLLIKNKTSKNSLDLLIRSFYTPNYKSLYYLKKNTKVYLKINS